MSAGPKAPGAALRQGWRRWFLQSLLGLLQKVGDTAEGRTLGATRRSSAQPGPVAHSLTDSATKPHANPAGSALLFTCEKGKAEAILILEMLSLQTKKKNLSLTNKHPYLHVRGLTELQASGCVH